MIPSTHSTYQTVIFFNIVLIFATTDATIAKNVTSNVLRTQTVHNSNHIILYIYKQFINYVIIYELPFFPRLLCLLNLFNEVASNSAAAAEFSSPWSFKIL